MVEEEGSKGEDRRNSEEQQDEGDKNVEQKDGGKMVIQMKGKRKLCMCPVCGAGPLQKLSNHLPQVHHMKPKERAKFLGLKRIFANPEQIKKGKGSLLFLLGSPSASSPT